MRVAGDERRSHLVEFLGPMGDVDDRAGAEAEPVAVVAELADELLGHRVGQDRVRQVVIERPAAQG
jgi:hypothetical protein